MALQQVPPLLRGSLLLALHLAVTGGLHLDGFADYSDALGAGLRGDEALRVMADPRRGGMALSYLATLLAVKLASLAYADPVSIAFSYVAAAESMYALAAALPPAKPGLGALFRERGVSRLGATVNIAALLASLAPLLTRGRPLPLAAAAMASVVAWLAAWRDARGRLGGFNGDVLGFTYELVHTAALTGSALAGGWKP